MAQYMYILKSITIGGYYIGSCENIEERLAQHNDNKGRYTKNKGPFELIYKESFDSKADALKREKQVKSYKGGRAFKKLVSASPSSSLA
ncbi:MAG: GIY-YIG nuclease family protein [Candidatus Omnitrophica bacterium]|nr:GIY-YIG nuclease family protein [Candidatus Omnitrophota bacterium]MBU1808365.1 GIY-YIG nuclease family protein [Candidatus Omnitrophota bacterium]